MIFLIAKDHESCTFRHMNKRINRNLIDSWIDKNGPDGLLVLAQQSGVSASTITKARIGIIPKKYVTRDRLCKAIGVNEDQLFPTVGAVGNQRAI
jgi:transcriptional regulator with XRE-family HTH domain